MKPALNLKPCPFCGTEDVVVRGARDEGFYVSHVASTCGLVALGWGEPYHQYRTRNFAADAWNAREPGRKKGNGK